MPGVLVFNLIIVERGMIYYAFVNYILVYFFPLLSIYLVKLL